MGQGLTIDQGVVWARFRELSASQTPDRVVAAEERPFLAESSARVAVMETDHTPASADVLPFPTRSFEGEAAILALTSLLLTPKRTARAVKRCERRMTRAVERIKASTLPTATAAATQLSRACAACGRCAWGNI